MSGFTKGEILMGIQVKSFRVSHSEDLDEQLQSWLVAMQSAGTLQILHPPAMATVGDNNAHSLYVLILYTFMPNHVP
jgi:hypothetical protein